MRLPFFGSKAPAAAARPGPEPDPAGVEAARTRARHRLIGAAVLLLVGVVGFPVLFETQPRPLPADTPYLVPEGTPARITGTVTAARPVAVPPSDAGTESPPPPAATMAAAVNPAVAAASSAPAPAPPAAAASAVTKPPAAAPARAPASAPSKAEKADKPEKTERTEKPDPATGRFVVQVGAYNDLERLKAARARLEKLGFKSYTQDVDSPTGRRTRVRVGPYATRQEAEAAAAKVKGAGMQAAILAL